VKALDTSVLLALLDADEGAPRLVKELRGEEVATTEANLLELSVLASRGTPRDRRRRREALARLRRRITVLPIDSRAVDCAGAHLEKNPAGTPALVAAMLGALEANGCEELLTLDPAADATRWKFRTVRIRLKHSK
jgi:predicted nucleic acid-binding protein